MCRFSGKRYVSGKIQHIVSGKYTGGKSNDNRKHDTYRKQENLDSKGELKNAVAKLDSLKYNYAKRGFNTRILEELDELDFARQYNSIFGSKYLYIKNADTKNHVIVDADSKEHDIAPDEIQVWYTGKLVCADVSKLTLSESETAAVRL